MFRFFIKNPVFSSVIAIIIVLSGLFSMLNLPLAEYPNITPPTITISAHYPGANAKVLERTVASPIEDVINGSTQMIYMNSTMSSNGDYNLVITFKTGTNLNDVIGDVLNRLNSALPILPDIVQQLGVTMRKSSQNLLMSIAMIGSDTVDKIYLSNYTYRSIYTELTRIKGVGDIVMTGARRYGMRIWLKPDIMAKLGISVADVKSAIEDQNLQVAIGKTGYPPTDGKSMLSLNINGPGYYVTPKQFEEIVIRANNNNFVRIKDIAKVALGAMNYDTISELNTNANIGLQIYLSPDANQLEVHKLVLKAMDNLSQQFPDGIRYEIAFDNTKFIEKALNNVFDTLKYACILVVLVIFLFLQKGKATIIPILTIPVSIIGTFAGMWMTGFSINNLTLFGLILSIGIVVDDSIVVIENIERLMHEKNINAFEASIITMDEVSSALIAIVLVLCSAFIPSAFLGGLTGILYRQFAVTISIAVIISGFTALTLTPALCAIFLKNNTELKTTHKFFKAFNHVFDIITDKYIAIIIHVIKHKTKYTLLFVLVLLSTILMFIFVPKGFIPNEDKGYFLTQITLPNNASLERTKSVTNNFINYITKNIDVDNTISNIGIDNLNSNAQKSNVASVTVNLKDWDMRAQDVNNLINTANKYGNTQKNAKLVSYNQPAIDGISSTNGMEFYIEDKVEGNYNLLQHYLTAVTDKLKKDSAINNAYFSFNANTTEIQILADINRAKMYNVNIQDVYSTLASNFGPNLVNYFYKMGSLFWVIMEGDTRYRMNPFRLNNLFVKNQSGDMVPMSSITKTTFTNAPEVIERFNDYLSAKIVVEPKTSSTTHEIMEKITAACHEILPKSYNFAWYGVSFQEQNLGFSGYLAFLFGITMIFLVLAGQFEMWKVPLVVIMGIPFALFGAVLILFLRGLNNDLYFQISLITLLGLSAKNSILITEFALHHYKSGESVVNAVLIASRLRFRPIIMTSLAFILGALPLAFAHGANSNAEHSVGTGIIGGMLGSTFISTIFVPMFFVMVMSKRKN